MTLIVADCLEWMREQPDGLVDVSMTSPPYEDARLYGMNFKLKGQKWVDWMLPRVVEMCRITDGLVFINAAGKRRNWMYSPVIEWLVTDLTRNCDIVCGPAPYVFHRIGIPGSGSRKYHRRDWEPIYAFARPECVPPKWTNNTAMGHLPKWAPGGEMSNRHADGRRKNQSAGPVAHARWGYDRDEFGFTPGEEPSETARKNGAKRRVVAGRNQWGHSLNSGATVADDQGVVRSRGKRPSHQKADKLHTKTKANGEKEVQGYAVPTLADPGNVIRCNVGGGQMGSKKAHENEAPFPESLVEFFVRSFCPPDGTIFDGFCGSGTVPAVAKRCGRKFIGVDIRESQIEICKRRLKEVQRELIP